MCALCSRQRDRCSLSRVYLHSIRHCSLFGIPFFPMIEFCSMRVCVYYDLNSIIDPSAKTQLAYSMCGGGVARLSSRSVLLSFARHVYVFALNMQFLLLFIWMLYLRMVYLRSYVNRGFAVFCSTEYTKSASYFSIYLPTNTFEYEATVCVCEREQFSMW